MSSPQRRSGILRVCRELAILIDVRKALPPEHRVVATRDADRVWIECLIEGPDMPEVPSGEEPPPVSILMSVVGEQTQAQWAHLPGKSWVA